MPGDTGDQDLLPDYLRDFSAWEYRRQAVVTAALPDAISELSLRKGKIPL